MMLMKKSSTPASTTRRLIMKLSDSTFNYCRIILRMKNWKERIRWKARALKKRIYPRRRLTRWNDKVVKHSFHKKIALFINQV